MLPPHKVFLGCPLLYFILLFSSSLAAALLIQFTFG